MSARHVKTSTTSAKWKWMMTLTMTDVTRRYIREKIVKPALPVALGTCPQRTLKMIK